MAIGRPPKSTVDYFPHYCRHKKTMFILEERYGNNGYAFWFKLLELLGDTKGHYLELSDDSNMEFLQAKTHLSRDSCTEILDLLAKLQAIDPEAWEQKAVWCQNFVDGVAEVYANRRTILPEKPLHNHLHNQLHNSLPPKSTQASVSTDENPSVANISTDKKRQTIVEKSIVEETIVPVCNNHFEAFYSIYPKKRAKLDTIKAFKSLNPSSELLDIIIKDIQKRKQSPDWLKDGGKYIPLPATYLRGRRWEDEDYIKGGDNGSRFPDRYPTPEELLREEEPNNLPAPGEL